MSVIRSLWTTKTITNLIGFVSSLGGSHIITPAKFLDDVKALSGGDNGVGPGSD